MGNTQLFVMEILPLGSGVNAKYKEIPCTVKVLFSSYFLEGEHTHNYAHVVITEKFLPLRDPSMTYLASLFTMSM